MEKYHHPGEISYMERRGKARLNADERTYSERKKLQPDTNLADLNLRGNIEMNDGCLVICSRSPAETAGMKSLGHVSICPLPGCAFNIDGDVDASCPGVTVFSATQQVVS